MLGDAVGYPSIPLQKNRAFFNCQAISRACAGGSLRGSVPMSSVVPIVTVSRRSVLSRTVGQDTPSMVVSSVMPPESVITPWVCFTS